MRLVVGMGGLMRCVLEMGGLCEVGAGDVKPL